MLRALSGTLASWKLEVGSWQFGSFAGSGSASSRLSSLVSSEVLSAKMADGKADRPDALSRTGKEKENTNPATATATATVTATDSRLQPTATDGDSSSFF